LKQNEFLHEAAQKYEARSAAQNIEQHFPNLYDSWEKAKEDGSLWHYADNQWFSGNMELWNDFIKHVKDRKCLEIGSGPFGYLAPCYWIKDRVIIDPLIDFYRNEQLKVHGKTFFVDEIKTYNVPAENCLDELIGKIDGFIVCRNALDHCEDPLKILENISDYAASGAYLLLWTDIYHLMGLDEGHRNITRSSTVLEKLLRGLEFEILQEGAKIRDPNEFIEFGILARKI